MRDAERTTRERIADGLRGEAMTASTLARTYDVTVGDAIEHVEHIARSLDPTDESLLVAPPACRECGFDGFDDLLNRPSRCPECKSETVDEPAFRIE